MSRPLSLCIHGHFYQPPRENPWIEEIEIQESAAPFHDWNERIHTECYQPNTRARVLDERGKITDIVNNFERMNFNFGPTLFSWLEEKHPETYARILEADRMSCTAHHGHGNAIAQVYNHMIMPLATQRDKVTQVRWGLYDFKHRFGRDPESIWLPETAVDEETLKVLVDEGIKFIILAPHQAEAVRSLDRMEWQDVSSGRIDPRMPYRCFLQSDGSKYIDIFFYDGAVSKDVGFGDLAFDAKLFANRIEQSKAGFTGDAPLIHTATDGETYGHHKGYGERALAYLLFVEVPKRGLRIVNYGEFLEEYPPRFAVRLKGGEGTSWSCEHGVKRWKDHCGCRVGGPAEWTQHWRKPLREAADWLSRELGTLYESNGSQYLKDVWQARDEFVSLILDRSEKNLWRFFERHAKRVLEKKEVVTCLKLLETQRHAMLTQTSCGWFFNDISGIETVQILQYAARAIQLAQEVSQLLTPEWKGKGEGRKSDLEEEFLRRLERAKSNLVQFKDGRGVYEQLVKPRLASLHHVVSYYAITSILGDEKPEEPIQLHSLQLDVLHARKESFANLALNMGRARARSVITREEHDLVFLALQMGLYDFRCSIKPFTNEAELEDIERELLDGLSNLHVVELLRKIDGYFGETYYALKDLLLAHRVKIISILTQEMMAKISAVYEHLYDENRKMCDIYQANYLKIPAEIRYAAQHTIRRQIKAMVMELARGGFNAKKAVPLSRLIETGKSFGVELKKDDELTVYLSDELERRTRSLLKETKQEAALECLQIQKLAKRLGLELNLAFSQDHVFELLRSWRDRRERAGQIPPKLISAVFELARSSQIPPKLISSVFELARLSQISVREFKKEIQKFVSIPEEES